jgi:hypothetical protein
MKNIFMQRRKGQIFLIIGIFVLLVLVLLKTETAQPARQALYAGRDWEISIGNIGGEYQKTADISLARGKNEWGLEANLNNFSNFSLDSFIQRGYVFQAMYSLAFRNDSNITVAVGNFRGGALKNVSINISSGQSAFIASIADRQSASAAFPNSDSYNITVGYYANEAAGNLTYSADSSVTSAFFVALRLRQADSFADDNIIFNKTSGS